MSNLLERNGGNDVEAPLLQPREADGQKKVAVKKSARFEAIDLFRGFIMIVMAW